MSDIAIKLFGRTIALPATLGAQVDEDKDHPNKEETTIVSKNREEEPPNTEDKKDQKPSDDDEGTESGKTSKPQEEQNDSSNSQEKNDSSNSQEKPLKKPDKLVPCPRCNSLETKFCYYNNYNVNQPRHFCKNCQRYWTDGGTMRNVPVGAGRRKNKSSIASQYRHLTISDGTMQNIHEHIHHPHLKPNGTLLSFGSDTPLSESIASVLNLANKNHRNGFHSVEEQSSVSSLTASTSNDEDIRAKLKEPGIQNCQGFTPQVPYLNGSPWPLPWIPPTNNMPASTFPMPFYTPQSYWGCTPWGLPWLSPLAASSVTSGSLGSIPNSATLGKHAREGDVHPRNSSSETGEERYRVWLPKTLRIADPEEAAKNSIWASMGFKSDKADTTGGGQGFFRPFQKKGEIRAHLPEALHANPAALSRSISFQESS